MKTIKRLRSIIKCLTITISACLLMNTGYGQLYINGKNIDSIPDLKIIVLTANNDWHLQNADRKDWYYIEYGQTKPGDKLWLDRITDSSKIEIEFANAVTIANFIVNKGWTLLSVNDHFKNIRPGEVNSPQQLYTFVKKN